MKKVCILIGVFIVLVIGIAIIGSIIVMGKVPLEEDKDILITQNNKEVYFSCYGYTIDNPNVVVNPYDSSPLTALIMFETNDYSEVTITIKGKNETGDIKYTFNKNKYHYIPVYGLYADYDNIVILESEKKRKEIKIKTDKLPEDFKIDNNVENNNFTFYNSSYPYAVDSNNEVRWYLNKKYYGNITVLDDSSIIIGSDRYDENERAISIYKMNLLGKVYSEYLFKNSYYGISTIYNGNILALSDKIMLIDMQTGELIKEYIKNDNFNYLSVNDDGIVVAKDDKFFIIKDDKLEEINFNVSKNVHSFYDNTSEYRIIPSNRFGNLDKTKKSRKSVSLFGYDKENIDGVTIIREVDRLQITNEEDDNVYLILDKLFDKRVYEISDIKYINFNGLSGKYTIYLKMKDKIYKTGYFLEV